MRKPNITMLLGTFIIALAALAIPAVAATEGPSHTTSDGVIVFKNGPLTGEFAGNAPHLRFYATNDMARTVYSVNFRALTEFSTNNSGEEYASHLMVARADFDSAQWTPTSFYPLKNQNGATIGIGFNFTLNSLLQVEGGSGQPKSLNSGDVVLAVKAYNTTRTITVNNQPVTMGNAEMKIDFALKNWPFANANDKIALQVNLHSDTGRFDLHEQDGTRSVDATHDEGPTVAEHSFHETTDVEQEVRFVSGPVTASQNIGFFHFVNSATVTTSNGQTSSVPVTASYKGEKEGNEMFFQLYLAYPSSPAGATLLHDPSIGLAGGLPTLYLILGGVAVAGLAAVVVIRRRHPQVQKDSKQN